MSPVYIHCPHCGHPVVIAALELRQTRRCRQCAEIFKPLEGAKIRGDGRGSRRSVPRTGHKNAIQAKRAG